VAVVHFGADDSPKVEFVPARIDDDGTPGCRIFDAGPSLAGIPTANVEPILLPANAGF
jgi:hypothetical protein